MSLFCSLTFSDCIKMEIVIIRHICAIHTVISPLDKYSYSFHISYIFRREELRIQLLSVFYFSIPAERRMDFRVPAATSRVP
mgnify:CR=1 FL=1